MKLTIWVNGPKDAKWDFEDIISSALMDVQRDFVKVAHKKFPAHDRYVIELQSLFLALHVINSISHFIERKEDRTVTYEIVGDIKRNKVSVK